MSFIYYLSRTFVMKLCWILSKAFLHLLKSSFFFSFRIFFLWLITFTDFSVYQTIIASMGWSLLENDRCLFVCFFLHSWIQFLRTALSNYVHVKNWSVNLFLCWIFILFGIQSTCGLKKLIEQCYIFCYFSTIFVE